MKRYSIRNEYSLGDQELYKNADKDDPEALLEAVAMSGLVGLLRQLGDLAQFAAEIFHDLHEEVISTASRGHGLIVRVQQLEVEFPPVERKLLSQTNHTPFLYNPSVDWHPNLYMDESTITQPDLPRFVMDSYEECRGPPRLFLLDKFDVAGAGACLKRFTDPSFFKTESGSATGIKSESQNEKKIRRVKKRGTRLKNEETPESFPSSHAKLHQLFLEESIESGGDDPDRRVKLKKRQFTGSLFDQENATSYMEKILDACPQEIRIVHEIVYPLPLTWTLNNGYEPRLEIVEIGTVSPVKETIQYDRRFSSSPNVQDIMVKTSTNGFNDGKSNVFINNEALKVLGLAPNNDDCDIPSTMNQVVNGITVAYKESKSEGSIDDVCNSEDVGSEMDNYMDALGTIESEVETSSGSKIYPCYSDGSLGHRGIEGGVLDSQSVGNSATSEDGNNFLKERDSSSSFSSLNALSETTPDIGDLKVNGVLKAGQEFGDISDTSSRTDSHSKVLPVGMEASQLENALLINELYSDFALGDSTSRERDQGHPDIATYSHVDPSFEVGYDSTEHKQGISSVATVGEITQPRSIGNMLPDPSSELCTSVTVESSETAGCDSIQADVPDVATSGIIQISDSLPSSANERVMDDSFMIEKPSFSRDKHQKLELEINDAGELYPENDSIIQEEGSMSKANRTATVSIFEVNADEMIADLDDPNIQAVNVDAESEHALSDQIEDVNNVLFTDAIISDIPCTYANESISAAVNFRDPELDVEKVEVETEVTVAANGKGDQNKKVAPFSSSIVHPEKLQDEFLSVTEGCQQHGDIATEGHRAESIENKLVDPIQDASLVSNVCSISNDFSLLHSLLVLDNESSGKLIVDNPYSSSSVQILQLEVKQSYVHPENASIIASQVISVHEATQDNLDNVFQTPGSVKQAECGSTEGVAYNRSETFMTEPPPQSAAAKRESTTGSSVIGMLPVVNNTLVPESRLFNPPDSAAIGIPSPEHNLEAPPLPPLPPMQWTLSKFQKRDGQAQVLPSLSGMNSVSLGPVQTMSLPTMHHTLNSVQPVALPSVHYTLASTQPTTLAAMHHSFSSVSQITLPTPEPQSETIARSSWNKGQPDSSDGYMASKGDNTMPIVAAISEGFSKSDRSMVGIAGRPNDTHVSGNYHQPNAGHSDSDSFNDCTASENHLEATENADTVSPRDLLAPEVSEQVPVNSFAQSLPLSTLHQQGFVPSEIKRVWSSTYDGVPADTGGNTDSLCQKKLLRPRNPLIDEVVAIDKSKLRKVDRVKPSTETNTKEGETLLEQMQLRKVEKVEPQVQTNAVKGVYGMEQLQLRKVVDQVQLPIDSKSEKREFLLEQLQLRKVGEWIHPEVEMKSEGKESPRIRLRKVTERIKQDIEARSEEMESPRLQLRKVAEKTRPAIESKTEERNSLFDQIRNKSFSLKPAFAARPNIRGPRTNLKLAAILEKASNIRQAMAGSDEDDADTWSDC